MVRNLVLILFAVLCSAAFAYQYPIKGVKGKHSASFAEMRPAHFHSGLDIKTDGAQGKAVVAVADGYISSVIHSPFGYGQALCVTHPGKGTITLYAHLSRYCEPIEQYVRDYRYANRLNSVNISLPKGEYPVSKGDVIGYSGNTGNSFGPHLHFELRDASSTYTYNVVRSGYFKAKDKVAPQLLKLHYVEVDTLNGVVVEAPVKSWSIKHDKRGYTLQGSVKVGRSGYFVIECRDRHSDNGNSRFGVYRVSQRVDGRKTFEYRMDKFALAKSLECDLVSYYPLQRDAKAEVIRLCRMQGASKEFYTVAERNGGIRLMADQSAQITIEVEDDCGNISTLRFEAEGKADNRCYKAQVAADAVVAGAGKGVAVTDRWVRLYIGENALYAPSYCRVKALDSLPARQSLVMLSKGCRVLDETMPLKGGVTVAIDALVQPHLLTKCCVASVDKRGNYRNLGGYISGRRAYVYTRTTGDMVVVADTVAPTVKPRWKSGADLRGAKRMAFTVGDNFAGIDHYELFIDSVWHTLNYAPLQSTLYHTFDRALERGKNHKVLLRVRDRVGNVATFESQFYR